MATGQLAGYRFWVHQEDPLPFSAATAREKALSLLRCAARHGQGLECHLIMSHIHFLHLRPCDLDLARVETMDQRRVRLSIPVVPLSPLPSGILRLVREMQAAGWAFALCGMDLGAHGLANLIELEPALITLDRKLIKGLATDQRRQRNLARLGRARSAVGAYAVAERVETEEDRLFLREMGIEYAWGPVYSKVDVREPLILGGSN